MIRVSNKTKLVVRFLRKIALTTVVGSILISALILANYKPVYTVLINGEEKGYVTSKMQLQDDIEDYLQRGNSEKVGYILLNDRPEYEFHLVKKDVPTKDDEILAGILDSCDVFYKIYAVNVNDEVVCTVDSLITAQQIVDEVNEQQKDFTKKATVQISENYEKAYDETVQDVELAVKDIMKPIKEENDKIVKQYVRYSSAKSVTVPQSVLDRLANSDADLTFGYPVSGYVITSRYGWRRSGFHTGVDYAVALGTPIHAAEDGVVTMAQWSGNYGYLVKIQHAGGFETRYAHCSRFAVSVGDTVKKGDVVAYVGSTGNSTGPHVHLEVRYEGNSLDPETFVQ